MYNKIKEGYLQLCLDCLKAKTEIELLKYTARAKGYAMSIQDLFGADIFIGVWEYAEGRMPRGVQTICGVPTHLHNTETSEPCLKAS